MGEQWVVEEMGGEVEPGSSLLRKQEGAKKLSVGIEWAEGHRNVTRLCAGAV